jgi:hypothetical protein
MELVIYGMPIVHLLHLSRNPKYSERCRRNLVIGMISGSWDVGGFLTRKYGKAFRLGHDRFPQYPFQFMSSVHSTLLYLGTDSVLKQTTKTLSSKRRT